MNQARKLLAVSEEHLAEANLINEHLEVAYDQKAKPSEEWDGCLLGTNKRKVQNMYTCSKCGATYEKPQGIASCMAKHKREEAGRIASRLQVIIPSLNLTAVTSQVPVLQIGAGKLFEHRGVIYRRTKLIADKVIGWYGPDYYQDKAFDLNTLVTPK